MYLDKVLKALKEHRCVKLPRNIINYSKFQRNINSDGGQFGNKLVIAKVQT